MLDYVCQSMRVQVRAVSETTLHAGHHQHRWNFLPSVVLRPSNCSHLWLLWLTCVVSRMIMRTHILTFFLLSSAKSDLLDSKYSGTRHFDYNQWRPVYRGKEGKYEAEIDNNYVKESVIVYTDPERRNDDKDRLFINTNNPLVEGVRQFLFQKIDTFATNLVSFGERWLGPGAEVSYDLENKTVKAYGIDFNILFALDQLFLVATEFWAYVTTDLIFRVMWPE